jgi:hypothetical protein
MAAGRESEVNEIASNLNPVIAVPFRSGHEVTFPESCAVIQIRVIGLLCLQTVLNTSRNIPTHYITKCDQLS